MRIVDPSVVTRPEDIHNTKERSEFRFFDTDLSSTVRSTYEKMHANQSFAFVQRKKAEWLKLDKKEMTVMEALVLLNELVDESDPDVSHKFTGTQSRLWLGPVS
eukprot:m.28731 g.28731  ORF g.28731 m.28731 type:complete len:104 (+) comp30994_c0_seq4:112-423(+)